MLGFKSQKDIAKEFFTDFERKKKLSMDKAEREFRESRAARGVNPLNQGLKPESINEDTDEKGLMAKKNDVKEKVDV